MKVLINVHLLVNEMCECIDVFCMAVRTNSDYFLVQHYLIGFYNRDGECLLRGTN